jgi:hypothetical protein
MARGVASTLKSAIQQLEKDRDRIQKQIVTLKGLLADNGSVPTTQTGTTRHGGRKRRRMTAEQRAAVGKRMKAYWAKRRAGKKKGKAG